MDALEQEVKKKDAIVEHMMETMIKMQSDMSHGIRLHTKAMNDNIMNMDNLIKQFNRQLDVQAAIADHWKIEALQHEAELRQLRMSSNAADTPATDVAARPRAPR